MNAVTNTRRVIAGCLAAALMLGTLALLPAKPVGAAPFLGAGRLDDNFNGDGIFKLDVNTADRVLASYLDSSDRLLMVGYGDDGNDVGQAGDRDRWAMARVDSNGNVDPSFSGGYQVWCPIGDVAPGCTANFAGLSRYNSRATDATLNAPGNAYVVVGTDAAADGSIVDGKITRLNPATGVPFGGISTFTLAAGAVQNNVAAVAVQSTDNKIVVGWTEDLDLAVTRLLPSDAVDTTFGTNGFASYDEPGTDGQALDVAVDAADNVYVLGHTLVESISASEVGFVARFTPNGILDSAYGTGGIAYFPFERGQNAVPDAFVVRPDGSLVATGQSRTGVDAKVGLVSLTSSGQLDTAFAHGAGFLADAVTPSGSIGRGIDIDSGKIYVGITGRSGLVAAPRSQFVVARYDEATGSRDSSYGRREITLDTGVGYEEVELGPAGSPDRVGDITVDTDGTAILVGGNGADFSATRHESDNPDALEPIEDGDIDTFAGGLGEGTATDIGLAPMGVATTGRYAFVTSERNLVRKVDLLSGVMSVIAGNASTGDFADGYLGTESPFGGAVGLEADAAGNVYVAMGSGDRVRRITPAGVIEGFAGTGAQGNQGDGGPASGARLNNPQDIAFDDEGNAYIADSGNHVIRKVTAAGTISAFAGTGSAGDGLSGAPTAAALNNPTGVGVDADGNVYIADTGNHRVKVVTASDGQIHHVAGNGVFLGTLGDGGQASAASVSQPADVVVGPGGVILIAESARSRVRAVDPNTGVITTWAGGGFTNPGDGGSATSAQMSGPVKLAYDSAAGSVLIADRNGTRVRRVVGGVISTVAGNGTFARSSHTSGQFTQLAGPNSVKKIGEQLYFTDTNGHVVYRQDPTTYDITRVAGTGQNGGPLGDGGLAVNAAVGAPIDVVADSQGNIYISQHTQRIRRIEAATGVISTYVGTGGTGVDPDGTHRTATRLNFPYGLAVDADDNLYYAETGVPSSSNVRRVDKNTGIVTTVAGSGVTGYNGDDIPATTAQLHAARWIAFGPDGNLYISDVNNNRLRRVDMTSGTITTIAGTGGGGGGGEGPALSTPLTPTGLAFDEAGDLFVADSPAVFKLAGGLLTRVAGDPSQAFGFSGDRLPATDAQLNIVGGIAIQDHDLFIADTTNNRIRKVMNVGGFAPPAVNVRTGSAQIAYASNRDGDFDIYVANEDGSNPTNLTPSDPNDCYDPSMSPDATKIVYVCVISGEADLFIMDSDGANAEALEDANSPVWDADVEWSPDGSKIAFASNRGAVFRIFSYDFNVPPSEVGGVGSSGWPTWSPDGEWIAFSDLGEIYRMRADGSGSPEALTTDPGDDSQPHYSPDGNSIAFISTRAGNRDVWIMDDEGNGEDQVAPLFGLESHPDWSPDGSRIVFETSDGGSTSNVGIIEPDGDGFTQITNESGNLNGGPNWTANLSITAGATSVQASPSAVPTTDIPDQAASRYIVETAPILQLPILTLPILQLPILTLPILQLPILTLPILQLPILKLPILQLPILTLPLGFGALKPNDLGNFPQVRAGLERILLSQLPIKSGLSWKDRLAAANPDLAQRPLQDITFADFLASGVPDNLIPTLAELDLNQGPFGRLSAFSLMLGDTRLSAFNGINWCDELVEQQFSCPGVGGLNANLVALEIAGVNLDKIDGLSQITMGNVTLPPTDRSALSAIAIDSTDLDKASIGSVKVRDIPAATRDQVVRCGNGAPGSRTVDCAGDATLAEAQDNRAIFDGDPGPPNGPPAATIYLLADALDRFTVQEVIRGSYESDHEDPYNVPAKDLGLLGYGGAGSHALTYTARFTPVVTGDQATYTVKVELPEDFRYLPGSVIATAGGSPIAVGDPLVNLNQLSWDVALDGGGGEQLAITFSARPGLTLGSYGARVFVGGPNFEQATPDSSRVNVRPNFETGDDLASATPIDANTLTYGHMDHEGDIDYFTIPVPQKRSRVTVSLNQCDCDADLVLYHPENAREAQALRPPAPDAPLQGVTDQVVGLTRLGEPLIPETLNDIPIADLPVAATSANRGTKAESLQALAWDSTQPTYTIQVSSYNGSTGVKPYGLRVSITPPVDQPPVGNARSFPHENDATTTNPVLPTVGDGVETLILADVNRMRRAYGDDPARDAMAALNNLAESDAVNGLVLDVGALPGVRAAQTRADAEPSDPELSNDVLRTINAGVDDLFGDARDELKHMVIVGTDEILPMARIPDLTQGANETMFAQELVKLAANSGGNNALLGAAANGMILTDDPYGAFAPKAWLGTHLYTPDVAIGRLVETPADVIAAVNQFLNPARATDADGTLRPTTNVTTGYDFMTAMANAIKGSLDTQLGGTQPGGLINDGWTRADLDQALASGAGILSPNAHMDATTLEPASRAAGLKKASSLKGAGAPDLAHKLLFTMGCHAGFSITNFLAGTATDTTDWAEASAAAAAFVANTGYGVGVRDTVAFSGRLFADFADNIGLMTLGQALMQAKQKYTSAGPPNVYDHKVIAQAVYFGLPNFKVASTVAPAPPRPAPPLGTDPVTGLQVASVTASNPINPGSDNWILRTISDGSYYELPGGDLVQAPNRPMQPRLNIDVTQEGKEAAGALIVEATSFDEQLDPALARPMIDLEAHEPEIQFSDVIFPNALQAVTRWQSLDGPRDNLALVPAQFQSTNTDGVTVGRERRFTNLETLVYYRPEGNTDHDPLVFRTIDAEKTGGNVNFRVVVEDSDGDTAERLVVLYHVPSVAEWARAELVRGAGDVWTASAPINGTEIEYLVQAVKDNGQVFTTSNKGDLFDSVASPLPPDAITGAVTGTPSNGWYANPASVVFTAGDPDVTFNASIDGVPQGVFGSGEPIPVIGGGRRVVTYTASDGRTGSLSVPIDTDAPSIVAEIIPDAVGGWRKAPATVQFHCTDTGGGVATCPAPVVLNAGSNQSVSGETTDVFGNRRQITVNNINVDGTAPTITGSVSPAPNGAGWHKGDVVVHFTCNDVGAGIEACPNDVTVTGEGAALDVTRTVSDRVGNEASATVPVKIDRTNPTVNGTYPAPNANGWHTSDVTVTFSCADALSGVASCDAPKSTVGEGAGLFVTGRGTDVAGNQGSSTFGAFKVDKTKPNITGAPTSAPNANGWYSGPVTIHFSCTDTTSGLDASACPADVVLTEGAGQSVTRSVTDRAGNTASATVSGINVDTTLPVVTVNGAILNILKVGLGGAETGTATDSLSGIDRVDVAYTSIVGGTSTTVAAALSCTPDRKSCTWTASPPPLGVYSMVVTAKDRAGHTTAQAVTLYVSLRL